jgi:hypothetical protein
MPADTFKKLARTHSAILYRSSYTTPPRISSLLPSPLLPLFLRAVIVEAV